MSDELVNALQIGIGHAEKVFGETADLRLYLILVRVYRLPHPAAIPNHPSYAGPNHGCYLTEKTVISGAEPGLCDFS